MIKQNIQRLLELEPRKQAGLLGVVFLVVWPYPLEPLQLEPFILIIFFMMFAASWDFLSGYTGQLNFGHAMFIAAGGYTSAILNSQHGIHPVFSILLGMVAAGILGLLIGIPALRLSGQYLSLLTLVVPVIMSQFIILWSSELVVDLFGFSLGLIPGGTGGQAGISTFPQPLISTSPDAVITVGDFQSMVLGNYYLALILFVLIVGYLYYISRTHTGDILTAIREDENAVKSAGLDPAKFKLAAFIQSSATAGLAGAVFVHSLAGAARPAQILNVELSINIIIMSIIGGVGTIVGAAVGGFIFGLSDLIFSNMETTIPLLGRSVANLTPLPFVAIGLVVLFVIPEGITPASIKIGQKIISRIKNDDNDVQFEEWEDTTVRRVLEKLENSSAGKTLKDYIERLQNMTK